MKMTSLIATSLGISVGALLLFTSQAKVSGLSASSFQAGDIISDSVFTDYNAMSANDVQTFLSDQMPNCDTNGAQLTSHAKPGGGYYTRAEWGAIYDSTNNTTIASAPYVCLKDYVENPTTGQNNLNNPGESIAGGMSAAQIIVDRAQQYKINPEVIIVTLQKEQGLVTDDWPWANEYQEAMGYNCPDTPQGCNSSYAGFYKQVDGAAWQFRYYLDNPNTFNYWIGDNVIPYAPGCAGSHVTIQNAATATLYIYTPYQPDATVLGNTNPTGSASGPGPTVPSDSCAAYGNRNFWWYFNSWFGPSVGDLVKVQGDATVYLLSGTTAYPIYDVNVLNDFSALGPVRTTTLGEINSYASGPTLNRLIGSVSSPNLYLVNANIKLQFNDCNSVADYGFSCTSSDIAYLSDSDLSKLVNGPPVTPLMKAVSDPTVYYVSGGSKWPIPSWADVQAFNIPIMNTLTDAFVNQVPFNSLYAYGPGSLVKTLNSPSVYVVRDLNNVESLTDFLYSDELGLGSSVRTIISGYSVTGQVSTKILCNGNYYVGTNGSTYLVTSPMMTNYGFQSTDFKDAGKYCLNVPISSQPLGQFIRITDGTIYYVSNGQKQAIAGYSIYQAHGGNSGNTIQVSDNFANSIPTGSNLTQ